MYIISDYLNYLKEIGTDDDLSIYLFKPTPFKVLAVPIEKNSFSRWARLFSEVLRGGYQVFYLVKDNTIAGYCVITPGGRRLKCSTSNDGVIGPLYICPEYRGKGLSEVLVKNILKVCMRQYNCFYCWIYEDNIPSRRSLESCGFKPIGRLDVVGKFRRLVLTPKGADIIYKRDNKV